jgi:hypothetical protein
MMSMGRGARDLWADVGRRQVFTLSIRGMMVRPCFASPTNRGLTGL